MQRRNKHQTPAFLESGPEPAFIITEELMLDAEEDAPEEDSAEYIIDQDADEEADAVTDLEEEAGQLAHAVVEAAMSPPFAPTPAPSPQMRMPPPPPGMSARHM